MTKKTRTILFLVCLFLFILAAPAAVFYSQGYRIDFNPPAGGKIITQTGGFFLKILPKQVEIYINGKLKEKTSFFFGSVLIENLLPKKYKVEIKKDGFYSWEKTLEIKEKEVTEAKNVILFPENLNFTILTKGVKDFWFSPDQRKIILKEEEEIGWALKLYELDKNVKSHLIAQKDISRMESDLLDLSFSQDSKEISLEIGMAEQIKYFTLEIDKAPPVLTEKEIPLFPIENVVAYQKIDDDIYYLDNSGYFFKNEEKLNQEPFSIIKETKYSLKVSPDFKKLVYFSDYEIWTLFLKDEEGQPQKKAGQALFLMRLSEKIRDCFWLNSDYLIFNSGDKIKITEIDERDRINVANVIELKNPEIFWNKVEKRLYVLSENNLFRSNVLLP